LNWFLWAHDFHDGTIKCLLCHHHLVQFLLGIQVHVTLHQLYIKVHLEGLISGVRPLPHLLSHYHHIFHCKLLPLHPYTPWRLAIPFGGLRKFVKGKVPFLWGSSRQLFQLWFKNWSSSMALITPRCSHSNNWFIMCTMRHRMSTNNILRGFWASVKFPIQLMPQPLPPLCKLHCKLPLHIMGLCPII